MSKSIDRRLERLEVEWTPDEDDVLRIEVEVIGQPELNKVTEVRSLPRRMGGTLQSEE